MSAPSDSPTHNELGTTQGYNSEAMNSGVEADRSLIHRVSEPVSASETVAKFYPSQKLTSWWTVSGLMVVVSIGLHGLLLFTPIRSEQKPIPPKPEKQVRVTQLSPRPKSPPIKASPKPVATLKTALPTSAQPKIKEAPAPPQPQLTSPPPEAKPQPTPPLTKPTPPLAKPTPQPTPSSSPAEPTSQTQPEPSPAPASSAENPWENFPKYPGAKPGCFEKDFCIQTSTKLDEVVAYFEKALPAKQYVATATIQEGNRKVYQVSTKDGKTQFLSLIFAGGEEGTVYVLGESALNLGDFKKAIEVPPEISEILTSVGLDSENIDRSYFTQPDLFYNSEARRPEISSISIVSDQPHDTLMDSFLRTNLQNNDYQINDLQKLYGGGEVYEVKKDQLKLYINLVPTQDQAGTIMVIWQNSPV